MEIRLFSLDLIGLLFLVMLWRGSALLRSRTVRGVIRAPLSSSTSQVVEEHTQFLQNIAKIEVPRRLPVLLEALKISGKEIVSPNNRKGLNPFLIPLARDPKDNSMTCYLRWPTQREDMDLQIVQTQEAGVKLVSPSTDKLCHRLLVESDFYGEKTAPHLAELVNKDGTLYNLGDYLSFLKSGKFPSSTPAELRLVLDRFVLSKVGPFVDCYERLAENFYNQGNSVSSLVTCERSATVFYSWGHPNAFHAQMLVKMDRIREAKDTARSCMANPKWTLASTFEELDSLLRLSGFSDRKIVGDMHAFRANDPRTKDIEENGVSPVQITLDQAAHLMDAVALGSVPGGWDSIRQELAGKYRDGGYPEMAAFIEAV